MRVSAGNDVCDGESEFENIICQKIAFFRKTTTMTQTGNQIPYCGILSWNAVSCNGDIDGNCPSEREGNMCRVPGEGVVALACWNDAINSLAERLQHEKCKGRARV